MYLYKPTKFDVLKSRFTRQEGFTNIESTKKIGHAKAIAILNSFIPLGASPLISLRIGHIGDQIGVGYYYMEDNSNALLSTILIKQSLLNHKILKIPIQEDDITKIAKGNVGIINSFTGKKLLDMEHLLRFGSEKFSSILYSLLAGDNIIIVHNNHFQRIEFIKLLMDLLPAQFFAYNRITTQCAELDGNENIVGVSQLPQKYRSHKKLFLPLDTIFVDLENYTVQGEGLKTNEFVLELVQKYTNSPQQAQHDLIKFTNQVTNPHYEDKPSDVQQNLHLVHQIRSNLGLQTSSSEEWVMAF